MDKNNLYESLDGQRGLGEGAWTPLHMSLMAADIGHSLEKGPANFASLRAAVEPSVPDDMMHQFLDVLVGTGKLKKTGDKYSILVHPKESTVQEKTDPVVNFAGYTIRNDLGGIVQRSHVDTSKKGDYGADPLPDGKFKMVPSGDVVDAAEKEQRLRKKESKEVKVTEGFDESVTENVHYDIVGDIQIATTIAKKKTQEGMRKVKITKVESGYLVTWWDAEDTQQPSTDKWRESITFVPKETLTEGQKESIALNPMKKEGCKDMPWQRAKTIATKSGADDPDALAAHIQQKAKGESKEYPVAGEDVHADYYEWPHVGWWKSKESIARNMTVSQLHYARLDCDKAARSNPAVEGKYRDEGSIYAMEMRRRGQQKECSIQDMTAKLLLKENKVRLDEALPIAPAGTMRVFGDRRAYVIRFKINGKERKWVRYNDKGMEAALADAKAVIAKEFPGEKLGSIVIDPAPVEEAVKYASTITVRKFSGWESKEVKLNEEDPKLTGEVRCKKCGALKQKTPAGKLSCPVCRKPGQDSFIKGIPILKEGQKVKGWKCQECGAKFSTPKETCPKCGGSDIDLAETVFPGKKTEADDTADFEIKGGDDYKGNWSVVAHRLKNGDWMVTDYSPIAMNMAEPMGRFKTKPEAVAFAKKVATANHSYKG